MAETKKQKLVKVKIPLTKTETEDVWLAINGRSYQIQRGVYVEVPEAVAELLENCDKQYSESVEFEANAAKNY